MNVKEALKGGRGEECARERNLRKILSYVREYLSLFGSGDHFGNVQTAGNRCVQCDPRVMFRDGASAMLIKILLPHPAATDKKR